MNKYLWKFNWYVGRAGTVNGLFVATEKEIEDLIGKYVYFGEILGKHSEVYGYPEESNFTKLEIPTEAVAEVTDILGDTWSGYNPLHYVRHECVRCENESAYEETWYINGEYICGSCVTDEETQEAMRGDYE